jgi:lipopolysaccharide transport system ATP-binding protein
MKPTQMKQIRMDNTQVILSVDTLTKTFQKDGGELVALKKVSFELKKGEILGIIGRNGAGKSTLLKVLSQITAPTSGEISYEGQLTSIIEIGTGFHADLSGEENIYLSALLQGYSKREIKEVYNQIVEFSGLQEFMGMPVKHYSSGMYLRLAFSIAFHSKISILLLDEVIAVGDTDFKRKCYSKLKELKARGTAIVLASHHLELIVEHSDRCLLLEDGQIMLEGNSREVVNHYYELIDSNAGALVRSGLTQPIQEDKFSILQELPFKIDQFQIDFIEEIQIENDGQSGTSSDFAIRFHCTKLLEKGSFEIAVFVVNMNGVNVFFDSFGFQNGYEVKDLPAGKYMVQVVIPADLLMSGVYRIGLFMGANREFVKEIGIFAKFRISPDNELVETRGMGSIIRPKLNWVVNHLTN